MTINKLTIDINLRLIIYCTEVQHYILAAPRCRDSDLALIPDAGDELLVLNARELALGGKGYDNLTIEALTLHKVALPTSLYEVERVGPLTIQIHPIRTLHLRTRVLCTRLLSHRTSPHEEGHNC